MGNAIADSLRMKVSMINDAGGAWGEVRVRREELSLVSGVPTGRDDIAWSFPALKRRAILERSLRDLGVRGLSVVVRLSVV